VTCGEYGGGEEEKEEEDEDEEEEDDDDEIGENDAGDEATKLSTNFDSNPR
jgi:hypothetical protein